MASGGHQWSNLFTWGPTLTGTDTSCDGHRSGRYVSYWNSVLLPPAKEVWGKVMCLQACVCPREGACSSGGCLLRGVPGGDPPDGYCCGWYASYWNAFLLQSNSRQCQYNDSQYKNRLFGSNTYGYICAFEIRDPVNEVIFVKLDELDRITHTWIWFNYSLTQAQKTF